MLKKNSLKFYLGMGLCVTALAGCGTSNTSATTATSTAVTEATTAASVETTTTAVSTADAQTEATSDAVTGTETAAVENVAAETTMTAGTYTDGTSPVFSDTRIKLTIDGKEVIIRMYDNTAADAFLERLPLENLNFYDLSGIEKPAEALGQGFSLGDETPGYDPVTGDMVIYRPWGNFTIFYGDFRYSSELVPLGQVESGLDIVAGQTQDFTGVMELMN